MIKRKKKNKEQNPFYDPTLKSRHASSGRFKKFTLISLIFSILFLVVFLVDIFSKGVPAFKIAYVKVDITFNEKSNIVNISHKVGFKIKVIGSNCFYP